MFRCKAEKEFLDLVLDQGRIESGLLTDDADLADRVGRQRMVLWKAQNVTEHRSQRV